MEGLSCHTPRHSHKKTAKYGRGIILKSELLGRAIILCNKTDGRVPKSKDRMKNSVDRIYMSGAQSISNASFADFAMLMSTRGSGGESFSNFKSRLTAAVTKLSSNGSAYAVSERRHAWLLINIAINGDSEHLNPIHAASSQSARSGLLRKPEKNSFPRMYQV